MRFRHRASKALGTSSTDLQDHRTPVVAKPGHGAEYINSAELLSLFREQGTPVIARSEGGETDLGSFG